MAFREGRTPLESPVSPNLILQAEKLKKATEHIVVVDDARVNPERSRNPADLALVDHPISAFTRIRQRVTVLPPFFLDG